MSPFYLKIYNFHTCYDKIGIIELLVTASAKEIQENNEEVDDIDVQDKGAKYIFFFVQFVFFPTHHQLHVIDHKL